MKVSPYLMLLITLIVTACNTPEEAPLPACDSGRILIAPTATRPADPDIYVPPTLPNSGYCPTVVPDDIAPATIYPEQYTTAEITNLSLDSGDQKKAAMAVGDDMMAVAWINDGDIYVALSCGGGHFQVRRVDSGNSASLDSGTMPINGRDEYVVYAVSHLCWHMYYLDWQGNDLLASSLAARVKARRSPLRRWPGGWPSKGCRLSCWSHKDTAAVYWNWRAVKKLRIVDRRMKAPASTSPMLSMPTAPTSMTTSSPCWGCCLTRWETDLVWFHLRYLEADRPTRCLNLLSRPQACGRAALCYQPDAIVSRLYLGIPATHVRLLQRMAVDFYFSLKPLSAAATIPAMQKMTAVADLPWDRPFLAHIVDSSLFLQVDGGEASAESRRSSRFLPDSKLSVAETAVSTKLSTDVWRLPTAPLAGLTQRLSWSEGQLPDTLIASAPDSHRWLLGRSADGVPLHVAGRVNLYGRQEAVAEWLVHQVTQMVAAHLVVIDGVGDLVPRLKRKAAVTRLLGKRLTYVDIDGVSLTDGFNPLAAVPGETDAAIAQRWQHWFQGMNVPMQAIDLLPAAQKEGVNDIPSLRKWLKNTERQGQRTQTETASYASQAVSSLNAALNRLTAQRDLREWLEWPTKSFECLPESALFFACKAAGWDREQLLRAVVLAALARKATRLIIHGVSWQKADSALLNRHEQVVIGNGSPLPDSTIILTESHAQGEAMIAERFLSGNALLQEKLSLLTRGEGLILVDGEAFFTSWNGRYNGHYKGSESVGRKRNV